MKVFISHKQHDSAAAQRIAAHLRINHNIDSYLDVIDPYVGGRVELLADHIRTEMGKCTQLLAVISSSTATSQWVPWEIGVATEKDFPLATFSVEGTVPPEFLRKWPYLRTQSDLDAYARASKKAQQTYVRKREGVLMEATARTASTKDFYADLRSALGQL